MFYIFKIKKNNNFLKLLFVSFLFLNFRFLESKISKKNIISAAVAGGLLLGGIAFLEELEQQRKQELLNNYNRNITNDLGSKNFENNNYANSPDIESNNQNIINKSKIYFKDIAGVDTVLREVKEVVEFIKNPKKFTNLGARIPRGILLQGPPGNGKTLIAKAVANEAGCNFVNLPASSLVELYVGAGPKKVREAFEQARKDAPTIIFMDEIDSVGTKRSFGHDEERRRTLTQILTEMDGFSSSENVIVIAATNDADSLDKALKRPGRFDRIIHVPNPDNNGRKDILNYYLNKLPKVEKDDNIVDYLVKNTQGFSGADLENLKNEAVMLAVRSDSKIVTFDHLKQALNKEKEKKKNDDNNSENWNNFLNNLDSLPPDNKNNK